MSRAKTTKVAKQRSALGLYRQVGELLNRKPKRIPVALSRQDGHQQAEGTPAKGEGENTSEPI